jgi:hypothetical protein
MVLDDSALRRSNALHGMMTSTRAIVADGEVSEREAKGFQAWIQAHPGVIVIEAVDELVGILTNVFSDGSLTTPKREQSVDVLERFGG